MTHQSGIHADEYVTAQLTAAQRSHVRALQVVIENESLIVNKVTSIRGSWREDYNAEILPMLDKKRPCYILFKLDSTSEFGNDWALISWVPDSASVREKMLYASTRATLRRQFGDHLIKEDLTGNAFSDVDLNGFEKHLTSKESPAPLTAAEIEKASNLNNEVSGGFYAARPTGSSLQFGLTNGAAAELQRFARGLCNYVQLQTVGRMLEGLQTATGESLVDLKCADDFLPSIKIGGISRGGSVPAQKSGGPDSRPTCAKQLIDMDCEMIDLALSEKQIEANRIASHTPSNEGRYHLYRFYHLTHQQNPPQLFTSSHC
ncbi:hypothetical protein T265_12731 [Opisthorchis viverrini]|uniref:ADF-H domain-containing protein n=1 Tax=Opisthorchis viverrini TaxID=6198 RepID=A0A075A0J8_OPIVI|nr:hypothetical protein T265_12731 [Opisthorchis viverrini]KER32886.1 hypothetical protein T265_12731 [Opisthorchis viverrini]